MVILPFIYRKVRGRGGEQVTAGVGANSLAMVETPMLETLASPRDNPDSESKV